MLGQLPVDSVNLSRLDFKDCDLVAEFRDRRERWRSCWHIRTTRTPCSGSSIRGARRIRCFTARLFPLYCKEEERRC